MTTSDQATENATTSTSTSRGPYRAHLYDSSKEVSRTTKWRFKRAR